ncbi:FMN-binding negative transcriptional regulator [Pantoea sp. B65]|uniref:FMN-binding negative transcriptional regulator n=1 Tax=Pantoea sp. B65 TaxID=2813359 RepID=UPI0039B3AE7C
MYLPHHFNESRTQILHDVIEQFPLGMLITQSHGVLDAVHLPFALQREQGASGTLHAHVARANPLWQNARDREEVLVVFRAGDAYISPNWYPSKQEHHKQVPTWNYRVVHARGRIIIHDDERYVRKLVARLTRQHEAGQPQPWKMADAPKAYIDSLVQAIVGIEIPISELQGKMKLGQNKAATDISAAGGQLITQGERTLGEAMIAALKSAESSNPTPE